MGFCGGFPFPSFTGNFWAFSLDFVTPSPAPDAQKSSPSPIPESHALLSVDKARETHLLRETSGQDDNCCENRGFHLAKRTRSRRPRDQKWDRKLTKKRFNRGPNFAISSSKRPFSVCAQCTNFATELCLGILSNHTTYFDEILQYRAPPML